MAEAVDVSELSIRGARQPAARNSARSISRHNAGINGPIKPAWEYPLEDWDR